MKTDFEVVGTADNGADRDGSVTPSIRLDRIGYNDANAYGDRGRPQVPYEADMARPTCLETLVLFTDEVNVERWAE